MLISRMGYLAVRYANQTQSTVVNTGSTSSIVIDVTVDSTVTVGSLIRRHDTLVNTFTKCSDNRSIHPAIGIVLTLDGNTATILISGEYSISMASAITDTKIYLSETGTLTTTKPTSGYVQYLGSIIDSDRVLITIDNARVKNIPF